MKISQLSTDRTLDVLCEITPYISNITSDEAVINAVGKIVKGTENINIYGKALLLAERIGEIIPVLLKNHRSDMYSILSIVNERTIQEIGAQNVMETMRQVRDVFQDKDLLAFFKSSAQQEQKESSAPSVNSPV